jgi:hypothetical protein
MRAIADVGEVYVLDVSRNAIVDKDVDVEKLGRKMGCLRPFEELADD